MGKFNALLKNELIKQNTKTSTKVIAVLVIVASVILVGIMKVAQVQTEKYMYEDQNIEQNISDTKTNLETEKDEATRAYMQFWVDNNLPSFDWRARAASEYFGTQVVTFQDFASMYAKENQMDEVKKILTFEDMKSFVLKHKGTEKQIGEFVKQMSESGQFVMNWDKIEPLLKSGDWKGYCQYMIDGINSLNIDDEKKEAAKWEYQYRLDNDIAYKEYESFKEFAEDKQRQLITDTSNMKSQLVGAAVTGEGYSMGMDGSEESGESDEQLKDDITKNLYMLENEKYINVADYPCSLKAIMQVGCDADFWSGLCILTNVSTVIGIVMIIIAGNIFAGEYNQGTVKFLVITPVKRGKIFAAKYFTMLIMGFAALIIAFIVGVIADFVFFGTGDLATAGNITCVNGVVSDKSAFLCIVGKFLLGFVNVTVMSTISFTISALMHSSALAIGISMAAMLMGSSVVAILKGFLHQNWSRYLIFANTNLVSVMEKSYGFETQTVLSALIVIAIHMVILLLIAYDGFCRKEI